MKLVQRLQRLRARDRPGEVVERGPGGRRSARCTSAMTSRVIASGAKRRARRHAAGPAGAEGLRGCRHRSSTRRPAGCLAVHQHAVAPAQLAVEVLQPQLSCGPWRAPRTRARCRRSGGRRAASSGSPLASATAAQRLQHAPVAGRRDHQALRAAARAMSARSCGGQAARVAGGRRARCSAAAGRARAGPRAKWRIARQEQRDALLGRPRRGWIPPPPRPSRPRRCAGRSRRSADASRSSWSPSTMTSERSSATRRPCCVGRHRSSTSPRPSCVDQARRQLIGLPQTAQGLAGTRPCCP